MIIYRKRDLKLHESVAKREVGIFQTLPGFPRTKKLKKDRENMDTRKTVLLADANEEFRGMLREIIDQTEEFTVVGSTGDGAEALQLIEQRQPDLVLMDITMPEMDGIQALKKIKAIDANASVVMCSAMGQQAMVIESIQSGARDFIVKPFQPDRVIEAVKKAVE